MVLDWDSFVFGVLAGVLLALVLCCLFLWLTASSRFETEGNVITVQYDSGRLPPGYLEDV